MRIILTIVALVVVIASVAFPGLCQAASGAPNSADFGYGGRLDVDGLQVPQAINAAAAMGLDWIALDFDWAKRWPDPNAAPDLEGLTQAIHQAHDKRLNVLLSISHAPDWAKSAEGPDAAATANLVVSLSRLYGDALQAVELFPSANTTDGWGAAASPAAYLNLLRSVSAALSDDHRQILLVAGGLTPPGRQAAPGDMDDRQFLAELYDRGAAPLIPIVSMRLPLLTGDPMQAASESEHRVLRHFEEIRQVMRQHNHKEGLIWITAFSWPNGSLSPEDSAYARPEEQAHWLSKAYRLLKAQLFIGAAFFSQLNPASAEASSPPPSIIQPDISLHPAFSSVREVITPNGTTSFEIVFSKVTDEKIIFKKGVSP